MSAAQFAWLSIWFSVASVLLSVFVLCRCIALYRYLSLTQTSAEPRVHTEAGRIRVATCGVVGFRYRQAEDGSGWIVDRYGDWVQTDKAMCPVYDPRPQGWTEL